jgi:hypothetical protein
MLLLHVVAACTWAPACKLAKLLWTLALGAQGVHSCPVLHKVLQEQARAQQGQQGLLVQLRRAGMREAHVQLLQALH